jgi:hypothetical protein
MMFMNCPDCGLRVRLVAPYLVLERCPRCLVRRRRIVEMHVTPSAPTQPATRLEPSSGGVPLSKRLAAGA